ncbi:MAG TPA: Na/Pi cotransporter family protein [Acetomicrobium flavidum]|uniref:Na/Pi cotransporter family protein n=1 Tax=Acetomicrobium flavidum TaxID=49896 RepID=UPI002CACCA83|nr:Na/Pi cotransporter family protein [Acetomicrobium flavidum]
MGTILMACGGIALFLYGMTKMGEGLQKIAGDKLRRILETLTSSRLSGVAVGLIVTAIIQSSGATSVMCVSFVNAGIMRFEQAIGVIMGANIGTTVTAQMVAFRLERAALPAIALGMALMLLGKRKSVKEGWADCFMGFGMLFLGLSITGDAVMPLQSYPPFINILCIGRTNPFLGVIVGIIFTALLQSSSAVTGLLVMLASRDVMDLGAALPIILGANIGTTSTALLASINTSLAARRTAYAHLLFNIVGVAIFFPFLKPFQQIIAYTSADMARQIANAHTIFNITTTLLLLPLMPQFTSLVCKLVKGTEQAIEYGPKYLDAKLVSVPFMAVVQTQKEVIRMAKLCLENLETAVGIFRGDPKIDRKRFDNIEETIDEIEEAISYYVAKVFQQDVNSAQAKILTSAISISADLERIGDHATAIVELADYKEKHNLPFSQEAVEELNEMLDKAVESVRTVVEALETGDKRKAASIIPMDDVLDELERNLRSRHIQRLNKGICYPASGVVFLDMLSHLERIGDHAVNIAEEIMSV